LAKLQPLKVTISFARECGYVHLKYEFSNRKHVGKIKKMNGTSSKHLCYRLKIHCTPYWQFVWHTFVRES